MTDAESKPDGTEKTTKPEAAEAAIGIISGFLSDISVAESEERRSTAMIAYMDRLILLAAGTLTLIFTVIGSISTHLATNHQSAARPHYIITACWLLVTSIFSALTCNSSLIKRQHQASIMSTFIKAEMKMKMSILEKTRGAVPAEELQKLPRVPLEGIESTEKLMRRIANVSSAVAQLSLFAAFLCLTMFIEANINFLLNAPK